MQAFNRQSPAVLPGYSDCDDATIYIHCLLQHVSLSFFLFLSAYFCAYSLFNDDVMSLSATTFLVGTQNKLFSDINCLVNLTENGVCIHHAREPSYPTSPSYKQDAHSLPNTAYHHEKTRLVSTKHEMQRSCAVIHPVCESGKPPVHQAIKHHSSPEGKRGRDYDVQQMDRDSGNRRTDQVKHHVPFETLEKCGNGQQRARENMNVSSKKNGRAITMGKSKCLL